jgi:hypothetical protein
MPISKLLELLVKLNIVKRWERLDDKEYLIEFK